jgi:GT2 family glycosyltransferase
LTAQRNQGIALADADVLFLIDDDSLMYADCAEIFMAVYEADRDGSIAGVKAAEAGHPPGDDGTAPVAAPRPASRTDQRRPAGWRAVKDQMLTRMGVRDFLPPYMDEQPVRPIPPAVERLGVERADRLMGAYMTYRREVLARHRFDEALDAYAYLEDSDISYRASRDGILLEATAARLCHMRDSGGRLSSHTVAVLGALNALVLHRLNSGDVDRSRRLMRPFLRRRMVVEALRDVHKRRWSLPQARGVWQALRLYDKVFTTADADLRAWFVGYQTELVRGDRGDLPRGA